MKTISAKDIRHLFGGKPSATPYHPTTATGSPAAVRTPHAPIAPKPASLESLFAALWEQHGNGIAPVREYTFHETRLWRYDFAFPSFLVAVECDGITHKGRGGRHNSDGDREKLNTAATLGWRVLRFSRMQLEDQPEHCAALVCAALEFGERN